MNIVHCTKVRFASFFSGGFITVTVVNPPERKLAKRTSVHCAAMPVMKPKLRSNSLLFIEFEDDFVRCHFALRARKSFTTFIKIVGNFKKKFEIVLTLKVVFLQKV